MLVLSPGNECLEKYTQLLGLGDSRAAIHALGRAITTSEDWLNCPEAVIVVRKTEEPVLAVLGRFDSRLSAKLSAQARGVERACSQLRYITYEQAEQDSQRLAQVLVDSLSLGTLRRARYAAIPRGGLIVLGMLAYCLELKQEQLEPPAGQDELLIVVDDCALTGARFHRFLRSINNERVVFVHLYSHPHLRREIQQREARVSVCLSVHNLVDYAPANLGDEYTAWRQRWRQDLSEAYYWIGQTEHISFAWNEPERNVRCPADGQIMPGWNILPPELCLQNRPKPNASQGGLQIQIQPPGKGPLKPGKQVIYGLFEGQVVLGDLHTGESFGLPGVAGDIWQAIVRHGNQEHVVAELLAVYHVDQARLQGDVAGFIDELLERGLLELSGN